MKERIAEVISKTAKIPKLKVLEVLEICREAKFGDYAFPCFLLAKEQKRNPVEIAKEIASKLENVLEIEKVNAVGPYVNIFLNRNLFVKKTLDKIQKEKNKYGSSKIAKDQTMIEFSEANTHKAFHIGHVRGTSLGESIARIMEFSGKKVLRANYQGDTGMHVAKWIWCYKNYHKDEKLRDNESWVASIYVDAVKRLGKDKNLQNQVDEINRKLESKEDKELNQLWKKTRKISLNSLEKIYKELNTHFDNYFFESEFEKRGKEISQELIGKHVAQISEGATIVDLKNYDKGVWVLLRKDGTVLYSAKDLALVEKKFNDYNLSKAIYVVGAEQKLHFQQLAKTLELMKFKHTEKCKFIHFELVRLPTGKMSSRTGENVLYSDFEKELAEYAKEEIKKRYIKINKKELESRALAISIASLKYSMLKQDLDKVIVFNKEESLSFEGNTGPYILYTYARARSILRKAKTLPKKYEFHNLTDLEKSLVFELNNFPQVVSNAFDGLSPNLIANYAYQLAQTFNEFYHANQVIGSESEKFRLVLVDSFSHVLKNALHLLGINVIEKM